MTSTLTDEVNLRDIGGHVTDDGAKVATGLVFRSAALGGLSPTATARVAELGLRHVYDLRTAAEQAELPDDLPPGASLVSLDVFADAADLAPARLRTLFDDPAAATELLGSGVVGDALQDAYRRIVNLPSAHRSYHQLFTALADDGTGPAVYHCTAGKDRTGWATAVLLLFLGVSRDAVMADYMAGNTATLRAFQPQLDAFAEAGGNPDLLVPLFQVQEANLDVALTEATTQYGSLNGYLTTALSLPDTTLATLRTRLLLR